MQCPSRYLQQPSPKPVVPIKMAIIGPPKSGKTACKYAKSTTTTILITFWSLFLQSYLVTKIWEERLRCACMFVTFRNMFRGLTLFIFREVKMNIQGNGPKLPKVPFFGKQRKAKITISYH